MERHKTEFRKWLDSQSGQISYNDYVAFCNEHGMNSYEREEVYRRLTNEALTVILTEEILPNCTQPIYGRPYTTYNEAAIYLFIPLLLARLKE